MEIAILIAFVAALLVMFLLAGAVVWITHKAVVTIQFHNSKTSNTPKYGDTKAGDVLKPRPHSTKNHK